MLLPFWSLIQFLQVGIGQLKFLVSFFNWMCERSAKFVSQKVFLREKENFMYEKVAVWWYFEVYHVDKHNYGRKIKFSLIKVYNFFLIIRQIGRLLPQFLFFVTLLWELIVSNQSKNVRVKILRGFCSFFAMVMNWLWKSEIGGFNQDWKLLHT